MSEANLLLAFRDMLIVFGEEMLNTTPQSKALSGEVMNTTYVNRFNEAVQNAEKWGAPTATLEFIDEAIGEDALVESCLEFMAKTGYTSAQSLNGECIPVHVDLYSWLLELNLLTYVTIGDVEIDGESRYEVTEESLQQELANPATEKRVFHGHVWLTLPNGGILDLVMPSSLVADAVRLGREIPPLSPERAILCMQPNSATGDYIDPFGVIRQVTYQPMVVGMSFLRLSDPDLDNNLGSSLDTLMAQFVKRNFGDPSGA